MKSRFACLLLLVLVVAGTVSAQTMTLFNGMVVEKSTAYNHPGSSVLASARLAEMWVGGQGAISSPSGSMVYFHTNGAVKQLTLANDMQIPGGPVAKVRTDVLFREDGNINRINLAYDYEVQPGLVAQAGSLFEYGKSGNPVYFVPKYDVQFSELFWAKAGQGLAFYENGKVRYITLARPARAPEGFEFLAGMTIGFSDAGLPVYAHFIPSSEYTEPYSGIVTKAGSKVEYNWKTVTVTLVPARDVTDPATGTTYKADTLCTIKL